MEETKRGEGWEEKVRHARAREEEAREAIELVEKIEAEKRQLKEEAGKLREKQTRLREEKPQAEKVRKESEREAWP